MATIGGYITSTLARFGVELTTDEVDVLLLDHGLESATEYTAESGLLAKWALVAFIPQLLAMPDVTEDGYSKKYDRGAIIKFLSFLSTSIGVPDPLADPSDSVTNMSEIW